MFGSGEIPTNLATIALLLFPFLFPSTHFSGIVRRLGMLDKTHHSAQISFST